MVLDLEAAVWRSVLDASPIARKPRRWASPLDMAAELDNTVVRTPALNLIDRALVDVAEGREDRLIVSMPPQEAKSTTISRWYPEWLLSQVNPDLRIIMISYSDEIARRWGADVKRDFESFNGDEESIDLGVRLRADSRAAGRWQVEGRRGGMFCAGVAGSVTGRPADCLSGPTKIVTPTGYISIRDIHESADRPLILSFNHRTGKSEWRRVIASRAIPDRPIVEVVTASGRRIRCTRDHRFFTTAGKYVAAADLRPGMGLLTAHGCDDSLRELREAVRQGPVSDLANEAGRHAVLLEGMPERSGRRDVDVRGLRQGVHQAPVRSGEVGSVRSLVLHEAVFPGNPVSAGASPAGGDGTDPGDRGRSVADSAGGHPESVRSATVLPRRDHRPLGWQEPGAPVRRVRDGSYGEFRDMPPLLQRGQSDDLPDATVFVLRRGLHTHAGRARETKPQGSDELLLRPRVCEPVAKEPWPPMHALRQADRIQGSATVLLLKGVQAVGEPRGQGSAMPQMRPDVLSEVDAHPVLRSHLRGCGPFGADGRCGEFALQGWHELCRAFPANAPADQRARWQSVPGMRMSGQDGADRSDDWLADEVLSRRASPERDSVGQPSREPDPALHAMPYGAPQVGRDTVSVVRHLYGVRDTVYDLQVEGNGNFFAEEVLVHNCILIDDPIKDLEQAQSGIYRERFQRFWQGVAVPRLGPGARVVLVSTRWHEEDAAGWLIQREGRRDQGGRWKVINIPAIAEDENDPLGRRPGEPMTSARGNRDWAAIRKSVGEYVWASLYQGRPAPAEGGLFRRLWWRYWSPAPQLGMTSPRLDLGGRVINLGDCWRYLSGDLAASTRTSADFTVAAAWALSVDGDLILLDYNRARVGEAHHFDLFRPLAQRWNVDTVFLEASQYATTLVAEATRSGLHITPVQAETDKFSRALPYSARCSGGRVWLPAGSPKVGVWVDEHAAFNAGRHDDMVDTGSLATRVAVTKWAPPPTRLPQPSGPPEIDFMNVPF